MFPQDNTDMIGSDTHLNGRIEVRAGHYRSLRDAPLPVLCTNLPTVRSRDQTVEVLREQEKILSSSGRDSAVVLGSLKVLIPPIFTFFPPNSYLPAPATRYSLPWRSPQRCCWRVRSPGWFTPTSILTSLLRLSKADLPGKTFG